MERNKPQFTFSHVAVIAVTVLFVAGLTAFKNPGLLRSLNSDGAVQGIQTSYVDEWSKHVSESNEVLQGADSLTIEGDGTSGIPSESLQALQYLPGYAASVAIEEIARLHSQDAVTSKLPQVKGAGMVKVPDSELYGPRGRATVK